MLILRHHSPFITPSNSPKPRAAVRTAQVGRRFSEPSLSQGSPLPEHGPCELNGQSGRSAWVLTLLPLLSFWFVDQGPQTPGQSAGDSSFACSTKSSRLHSMP